MDQYNRVPPAKIFLLDDEELLVDILCNTIEKYGYTVKGFTDPKEALAQIAAEKPDAVVSDIKMPGMSGIEVCKAIQSIDKDLPVILLSGYLANEILTEVPGVYLFCEKPFHEAQMVGVINNAVNQYRMTKLIQRCLSFIQDEAKEMQAFYQTQQRDDLVEQLQKRIDELFSQDISFFLGPKKE